MDWIFPNLRGGVSGARPTDSPHQRSPQGRQNTAGMGPGCASAGQGSLPQGRSTGSRGPSESVPQDRAGRGLAGHRGGRVLAPGW